MPAWLITILIKAVLPIILEDLVKAGLLSEAGKVAIHYGIDFDQFLKGIKTYDDPIKDYPKDKNSGL